MSVVLNCHHLEEMNMSRVSSYSLLDKMSDSDASFMFSNLAETLKSLTFDTTNLYSAAFEVTTY